MTFSPKQFYQTLLLACSILIFTQCAEVPSLDATELKASSLQGGQFGTVSFKDSAWVYRYSSDDELIDSTPVIAQKFSFPDLILGSYLVAKTPSGLWSLPYSPTSVGTQGLSYAFENLSSRPFPIYEMSAQSQSQLSLQNSSSGLFHELNALYSFVFNFSYLKDVYNFDLSKLKIIPTPDSVYIQPKTSYFYKTSSSIVGTSTKSIYNDYAFIYYKLPPETVFVSFPDFKDTLFPMAEIRKNRLTASKFSDQTYYSAPTQKENSKKIYLPTNYFGKLISISPRINLNIDSTSLSAMTITPRFGDWPATEFTIVVKAYSPFLKQDSSLYRIDTLKFRGNTFSISKIKDLDNSFKKPSDSTWILWNMPLDTLGIQNFVKSSSPFSTQVRTDTLWLFWNQVADTSLNIQILKGIRNNIGNISSDSLELHFTLRP